MNMNLARREFLAASALAGVGMLGAASSVRSAETAAIARDYAYEVVRSVEEWRALLTDQEFHILRERGTELPKSSPLWSETRAGTYHCRGCGLPSYRSERKVILDKGWAFFRHGVPDAVLMDIDEGADYSAGGMGEPFEAIEAHCRRCGSHLGHILYIEGVILHCINGASLRLELDA